MTLANELYRRLKKSEEYGIRIEHRDIEKGCEEMSFSGSDKRELERLVSPARHCQIAELSAIFSFAVRYRGQRKAMRFSVFLQKMKVL